VPEVRGQARGRAPELEGSEPGDRLAWERRNAERKRVMARWQGWRSALTAAVVLVMLAVAFVAGTAGVALLTKYMPAIGQ
jgi:hypothetical protein